VSPDELDAATARQAEDLARLAPLAVQAMKRILRDLAGGSVDEAAARSLVEACAASTDLQEGLNARREGRAPDFRGA
jgi:enoyl-CoA hydratase/carnithine racemase